MLEDLNQSAQTAVNAAKVYLDKRSSKKMAVFQKKTAIAQLAIQELALKQQRRSQIGSVTHIRLVPR